MIRTQRLIRTYTKFNYTQGGVIKFEIHAGNTLESAIRSEPGVNQVFLHSFPHHVRTYRYKYIYIYIYTDIYALRVQRIWVKNPLRRMSEHNHDIIS